MRFSKILTMTIVTLLTLITFCSCSFLSECDFINRVYDFISAWFPCEHENSEWILMEEPTCEFNGYRNHVCNDCGETLNTEFIDMLPHNVINDRAIDSTCSKTGITAGKHCADCGKIIVAQTVIEKKPHTAVVDSAVKPTCETDGLTEGSHCFVCDEIIIPQTVIEAYGHTDPIKKDPTCTEYGYVLDACTVCGTSDSLTIIKPLGHKMELQEDSYAPECEKDGVNNYKCSVCGVTESEVIPALGHKTTTEYIPATCYELGKTLTFCSVCNEELAEPAYDTNGALNPDNHHKIETRISTPATCTSEGSLLKYCLHCNYITTEIIPITHNWEETGKVTPPNCVDKGYTLYTCKICGTTEQRDLVDALGHNYTGEKDTVLPVCGMDGYGYYRYHCKNEGCDSYVDEVIEYNPFNCDHHGEHGNPVPVCTNPEHKTYSGVDVAPGKAECDCTGSSIIHAPTNNNVGFEQYECSNCGSRYYIVLPSLSDGQ